VDANVLCGAPRPEAEPHMRLLSSFDSLLAATATIHGLIMVTRNQSDFPPELSSVNPWVDA
jgi:predicted nucleic acid-binding protein